MELYFKLGRGCEVSSASHSFLEMDSTDSEEDKCEKKRMKTSHL